MREKERWMSWERGDRRQKGREREKEREYKYQIVHYSSTCRYNYYCIQTFPRQALYLSLVILHFKTTCTLNALHLPFLVINTVRA